MNSNIKMKCSCSTFRNFRILVILMHESKSMTFYSNDHLQEYGLWLRPWWEKLELYFLKKMEYKNRHKSKLLAFFGKFGQSETSLMDQNEWFQIKAYSTSVTFSIQALIEKIKTVVAEGKGVWILRCINKSNIFRKFWTIRILTDATKPIFCQCNIFLQVQMCRVRTRWRIWTLSFWRRVST